MADNTQLPIPASTGDVIAADDIGGVKFQRVKMILGADGVNDGDVSSSNPLPVSSTPLSNITVNDVINTLPDQVVIELQNREFVQVLMYGTFTTLTTAFEASPNSTNGTNGDWFSVRGVRLNANTVETGSPALNTGNYGWRVTGLIGMTWFRVRCTAGMSGTANITLTASPKDIDPIPASEGGPATQSGTWFVTLNGRADGGDNTHHHLVSSAGTNATLVASLSRSMGVIHFSNNGVTPAYLKLYNSSTIPTAGSGTPSKVIMAPPMQTIVVSGTYGMRFTAGLGYTITGGAADSDTTAILSGQCIVGITNS